MPTQKFPLIQKFAIISLLILCLAGCKDSTNTYEFGELSSLALGKTDKALDWHGFTELYEHIFYPLKDSNIKILEIGIGRGGSLILWQDYFPNANIYGIDIRDRSKLNSKRIKTFIADQANRNQLKSFIDKYGSDFEIIIDDGGHTMEQQQISLGYLFKNVKPGGYYIIEDVHTSLPFRYRGFGVEKDERNTTLYLIKNFIRKGSIKSKYLKTEEGTYLRNHIEYCNLFFRNNRYHSIVCVFKKRMK